MTADPRRLGRRGSYRLGSMGGPPSARPATHGPRYPTWTPGRRGPVFLWLLACLGCAAVIAVGALAGLWYLPFLAGQAGWGAALAWLALRDELPEQSVARSIAALGGLPAHATVGVAVTLAVAVIQAVAGLWLGRALAPGHAR